MAQAILHAKRREWALKALAVLIVTGILPTALAALLFAVCDVAGDGVLLVALVPAALLFARWLRS